MQQQNQANQSKHQQGITSATATVVPTGTVNTAGLPLLVRDMSQRVNESSVILQTSSFQP